jgi:hypothetical protein
MPNQELLHQLAEQLARAPQPNPTQAPFKPDFSQMKAAVSTPAQPSGGGMSPGVLQALMYALQAYDSANTAKDVARGGKETNPLLAPFSHGGAPTMALGFALGDLLRNHLLKHASQGTRNTADGAQALTNLLGIMQTNSAMSQPTPSAPGGAMPAPTPPPGGESRGKGP